MLAPPPVSVLFPVRDGAEHLRQSIGSLEAQTFGDFEVVVIDDGSTDDTPDILAEWAARDPRVHVERTDPQGIVRALELGRARARGKYLARMDSDDISLPTRFERQHRLAEVNPEMTIVGCRVEYFPRDVLKDGALRYEGWLNGPVAAHEIAREIFVECPLAHPTFFMRADAVERIGGYRDLGWPEDYDLVFRMWRDGGHLGKVPDRLLLWRERADRLSRTDPRYTLESFRRCKLHHLVRAFPQVREGVVIWGAGPVGKALARDLIKAGVPIVAFCEVDPRKIGQEIHGAQVLNTAGAVNETAAFHLGAVGQEGARGRLRKALTGAGFRELENFALTA